jgi:hypothetical protein
MAIPAPIFKSLATLIFFQRKKMSQKIMFFRNDWGFLPVSQRNFGAEQISFYFFDLKVGG